MATVSRATLAQSLYLTRFSNPRHVRPLYRWVAGGSVRRIVEIGMGNGQRARNLIALAARASQGEIRYTGIDLFESRTEGTSQLTLKQAHQFLQAAGSVIRLVPGSPLSALSRCANELRGTGLVIISAEHTPESVASAWHFLPRMLHKDSQVWCEQPTAEGAGGFEILSPADVRGRAPNRKSARPAA